MAAVSAIAFSLFILVINTVLSLQIVELPSFYYGYLSPPFATLRAAPVSFRRAIRPA